MYDWIKGNTHALNVTMYDSNITLNSYAASYFQEVRWVMIGINREKEQIAIKPITKKEKDLKLVPLEHLHKISIGKGYARISNKATMNEISLLMGRKIDGLKMNACFNEKENLLIINLKDLS